jgi:hypothetical protein
MMTHIAEDSDERDSTEEGSPCSNILRFVGRGSLELGDQLVGVDSDLNDVVDERK